MISRIINIGKKDIVITVLRYLAGFVFIPTGLVNIMGYRYSAVFPNIYSETFFNGLFNAGLYWNFLGYCHLFTALLLFTQRLTALSAVIYFSIALNKFLVTVSSGSADNIFVAFVILTLGMLLLICDWSRVKSLFGFYPHFSDLRKYKSVSSKWGIIGFFTYVITIVMVFVIDKP